MTQTTVFYIPGLGGRYDMLRELALKLWNRTNRRVVFVSMNWTDKTETFQQKKERLHSMIMKAEGQVIVIGESAGAAMGLIITREDPAVKYIAFCGKIGGAASTGDFYYKTVPAFREMLPLADAIRGNLTADEKSRMITVRAYKDIFLSKRDNTIPGVKDITLPSLGHITTIFLGITILRYGLFRAINLLSK